MVTSFGFGPPLQDTRIKLSVAVTERVTTVKTVKIATISSGE